MTDGAWRGYRGGPRRTSVLERGESITGTDPEWQIGIASAETLPAGIRATDDAVYVGRTDGLSVLDPETGGQLWNYTAGVPEYGIEIGDGRVFLGTETGLVVLDSEDGAVITEITVDLVPGSEHPLQFCVEDETAYLATEDGISARYVPTGAQLWHTEREIAGLRGFAVGADHIYVLQSGWDPTLVALDRATGDVEWERVHRDSGMAYGRLGGVRSEGPVVISNETDTRYPVTDISIHDPDTGRQTMKTSHTDYWDAVTHDADVFLASINTVAKKRMNGDSGAVWTTELPTEQEGGNVGVHPFMLVARTLYFGNDDGVYGVDTETGDVGLVYKKNTPVSSLAYADDKLFVGTPDRVHALSGGGTKIYESR